MAEPATPDPLYVAARRVLLGGLEALGPQRQAAILIGAHAVYLRVGEGDLATTPHTTDADLALDPALLETHPLLSEALAAAGFWPKTGAGGPVVGSWVAEQQVAGRAVHIDLDLLVPQAVSGAGTRDAGLGPQGDRLARKAFGLELALFDNDLMDVVALDADPRTCAVRVAGVAALLISKAHKVAERLGDARRNDHIAKDALDMLRLLRGSDIDSLAHVLSHARSGRLGAAAPWPAGPPPDATIQRWLPPRSRRWSNACSLEANDTRRLVEAEVLKQTTVGRRNRAFEARELIDAFTDLERRLASPRGDTRVAPPSRRVPDRR